MSIKGLDLHVKIEPRGGVAPEELKSHKDGKDNYIIPIDVIISPYVTTPPS